MMFCSWTGEILVFMLSYGPIELYLSRSWHSLKNYDIKKDHVQEKARCHIEVGVGVDSGCCIPHHSLAYASCTKTSKVPKVIALLRHCILGYRLLFRVLWRSR